MFYCDSCAKENDWPVTMFRSLGTCEECGARTACSERSVRDLTEEGRTRLPKPEEAAVSPIAAARPSPPKSGGSVGDAADVAKEMGLSLSEEALERGVEVRAGGSRSGTIVPADAPPPPPRVPGFTRFLSGEGFARWCRRMPLGDDPALNAHCVEARRRWHRYSVVLQKALPRLRWDFPTFTPRARPYDWSVDG
jgi:hypothetical protein